MTVVSMNYLLEAGVQFGHQKRRWNPKMKEYIFTTRDDIYIIDLQKTVKKLEEAYEAMKAIAEKEGKVLFVGTKKQAQEAAEECATRTNMYFVNERWLGGTLTNFKTIRSRIRRMEEIEKMEEDGTFDALPKKEVIGLRKEYEKLNIPVFGIVDTNCDPDMVDYVIPGNDDAIRAVKLITGVMANAIVEANGGKIVNYVKDEDKKADSNIMEKALETVKKKEDRKPSDKKETKKIDKADKKDVKEPKKETTKVNATEEKTEVKESKKEEAVDLSKLTVAELREMAKSKDIKGYSTMKKAELVEALK